MACTPATQLARVRFPVGTSFLGEVSSRFFSPVGQMSGGFRAHKDPECQLVVIIIFHIRFVKKNGYVNSLYGISRSCCLGCGPVLCWYLTLGGPPFPYVVKNVCIICENSAELCKHDTLWDYLCSGFPLPVCFLVWYVSYYIASKLSGYTITLKTSNSIVMKNSTSKIEIDRFFFVQVALPPER